MVTFIPTATSSAEAVMLTSLWGAPLPHIPIWGPPDNLARPLLLLLLPWLMPWRKGPLILYYLPHTEPTHSNCISKILPLNLIFNAFISHNLLFKNCKHTEKFKEWNNKHWYIIQSDLTIITSASSVPVSPHHLKLGSRHH